MSLAGGHGHSAFLPSASTTIVSEPVRRLRAGKTSERLAQNFLVSSQLNPNSEGSIYWFPIEFFWLKFLSNRSMSDLKPHLYSEFSGVSNFEPSYYERSSGGGGAASLLSGYGGGPLGQGSQSRPRSIIDTLMGSFLGKSQPRSRGNQKEVQYIRDLCLSRLNVDKSVHPCHGS